ncbi:MAG: hypothetical protein HQL89_09325 [Magnetococcales bacterium]|nr:hypothetical protein [Magnetococcales bacterium]
MYTTIDLPAIVFVVVVDETSASAFAVWLASDPKSPPNSTTVIACLRVIISLLNSIIILKQDDPEYMFLQTQWISCGGL